MMTFDAVSVQYGKRPVLCDVSFALPKGKITVLLGQNGVGKSTLLRCVNGLCPYTGRILLDGTPLSALSDREKARQIGILPQVLPSTHFTAQTLIELGRNPYVGPTGRLAETDRKQVENAIERTEVHPFLTRTVDTLSGGERCRAFLAMLVAQNPAVLLLDEPFAALDAPGRRQFYTLLRSLADRDDKTILVILHDLTEAMEIADHVVILQNGGVAFAGSRDDCLGTTVLEDTFGVQRFIGVQQYNDVLPYTGNMIFFR